MDGRLVRSAKEPQAAFDWPWYAFVPAGVYLLIHIAEGETITPMRCWPSTSP
jgi:hypothetical protein